LEEGWLVLCLIGLVFSLAKLPRKRDFDASTRHALPTATCIDGSTTANLQPRNRSLIGQSHLKKKVRIYYLNIIMHSLIE
jgi:hypothetical protein